MTNRQKDMGERKGKFLRDRQTKGKERERDRQTYGKERERDR